MRYGGTDPGAVAFGRRAGAFFGAAAGAAVGWGWFEAGWVRLRELELALPGLPAELDGLRIAHLSDFHLGVPSRGGHAVEQAVEWVAGRRPDLVAITGDLLTRPRGEPRLRELVGRLPAPVFAVLGNHDVAVSRDPRARASDLRDLEPAVLLRDEGALVEVRGRSIWIAGVHPRLIVRGAPRVDPNTLSHDADLRILLSHFPRVLDRLEPGRFELVLAGHMHDGQIAIPYPGGKLRLAHPTARYSHGVYRTEAATMHVSPGLGTTFVPFRFAARPEATELVLRSP
jgi:predicted MPP superfamily phosphohydrolase